MSEIEKVSFSDDLPPITRRLKLITTFAVYLGNIAFGCAFTVYGPALVDLRNKYDTETSTISIVFTVTTVSYLFGALASGFIYNFIHRQLGTVLLLGVMALSMYAAPIMPTLYTFFASAVFLGFTCGAYDATQIVWIMEIWQNEAGPFIQAQHFCYALGTLLPSLVLGPFLSKEADDPEEGVTTTTTTEASTTNPTEKLVIPFIIVGALVTVASVTQLLLFIFSRYRKPPPEVGRLDAAIPDLTLENNNNNNKNIDEESKSLVKLPTDWYKIKLIVLSAMFMGTYQGMEMCTMQFFSTFAQVGELELSKSEAAYVLAGLTGAFTAGRAAGILIILRFPPQLILSINLVIITAANFFLLFFASDTRTLLWIGAIVLGIGFSTSYASFCAFMERHLFFSNWVGAFMLVTGSAVGSIYPIIIGRVIEDNPSVITYTSFFSLFWCVLALALASKLVYSRQKAVEALKKERMS